MRSHYRECSTHIYVVRAHTHMPTAFAHMRPAVEVVAAVVVVVRIYYTLHSRASGIALSPPHTRIFRTHAHTTKRRTQSVAEPCVCVCVHVFADMEAMEARIGDANQSVERVSKLLLRVTALGWEERCNQHTLSDSTSSIIHSSSIFRAKCFLLCLLCAICVCGTYLHGLYTVRRELCL